MKLEIEKVRLVGTSRVMEFGSGLNLIVGPISTGKTTAIRMIGAVLGGDVSGMPPEVTASTAAVAAELRLSDGVYSVVRRLVTTPSARVDIAGADESARLPLARTTVTQGESYKDWLLRKLGLPRIEVPSAPSRAESDPTPVTISDYLLYCIMTQRDTHESVFGHTDTFKNIKRKYVFEILYGRYNVVMAELQEQLRRVDARIRQGEAQQESFQAVLQGTPWENRAELQVQLEAARRELAAVESEAAGLASGTRNGTRVVSEMSARARALDAQITRTQGDCEKESQASRRLEALVDQLQAQSAKLTRAIVADELLAEIDFVLCPRCGASVDRERAGEGTCLLCLQEPAQSPGREALIEEQSRLEAQVAETLELIGVHQVTEQELAKRIASLLGEREALGGELDYASETFVSDAATAIQASASRRAELRERIKRLDDYLMLFDRLDDLSKSIGELTNEAIALRARIDAEADKEGQFSSRIERLEANLRAALHSIGLPDFVDPETARIDRETYLPIINDRSFGQLSSPGLKLLVNVAHAVAHHQTALDLDLPLPGLLVIDGLSSHLGHEGFDYERLCAVYALLRELAERSGGAVQVLVADNDHMPGYESFERVALSPLDRLIPAEDAGSQQRPDV